jgi:hypothetical protein
LINQIRDYPKEGDIYGFIRNKKECFPSTDQINREEHQNPTQWLSKSTQKFPAENSNLEIFALQPTLSIEETLN